MNLKLLHYAYLLAFAMCASLLATAYYFEYYLYMEPCPLCMVQRLATLLIGIGFLAAYVLDEYRWPTRIALAFVIGSAIFGYVTADHHVYLQGLPPEEVPACGPSFDYMLETLPMDELWKVMLHGNGNCADVSWMMLGKSMPEWTRMMFFWFAVSGALALIVRWREEDKDEDNEEAKEKEKST